MRAPFAAERGLMAGDAGRPGRDPAHRSRSMSRTILIGALAITLSAALWVTAAVPQTDAGPGEWEDAERLAQTDPDAAAAWQVAGDRMALARWRSDEKRHTALALVHGRLTL